MKAPETQSLIVRKCICLIVVVFVGCAEEQKPAKLSQIPNTKSEDYKEALDIMQQAAKKNLRQYTKKAEQGDVEAQLTLGAVYSEGGPGVTEDYKEALKWYTKAAEQGHAGAQACLAALLCNKGKDYKEAIKWCTKAAEQGHAGAQHNLALMYYRGQGIIEDYIEAYKWILIAGMNGEDISDFKKHLKGLMTSSQIAEAQRLAKEYMKKQEEWERIKKDILSSAKQKAKRGDIESQFYVGYSYYSGKSVEQDYGQAHKWFTMAAEQGSKDAQFILARMYLEGEGVSQDDERAIEWFTKAANQGHSSSQAILAGLCTDYVEAYKWLLLVEKDGVDVSELKPVLLKDLTPSQIAEAQKRAKEFVEK